MGFEDFFLSSLVTTALHGQDPYQLYWISCVISDQFFTGVSITVNDPENSVSAASSADAAFSYICLLFSIMVVGMCICVEARLSRWMDVMSSSSRAG